MIRIEQVWSVEYGQVGALLIIRDAFVRANNITEYKQNVPSEVLNETLSNFVVYSRVLFVF